MRAFYEVSDKEAPMSGAKANVVSFGCLVVIASAILIFSASATRADETIYSNIPATSPFYVADSTYVVNGVNSALAMAFTPSGSFDLTEIILGINYQGTPGPVTVTLNSDSGDAPGTVLESWSVTGMPDFYSGVTNVLETATPTSTIGLTSGDQYWIEISSTPPTLSGWYFNDTSAEGTIWGADFGTMTDQINGSFDVQGVSVTPEPATWLLCGIGLASVFLGKRRRLAA
jgi:hypothetical protein